MILILLTTVFIQSIEAYNGAQSGDINIVKTFLSQNPSYKDRPLIYGYTLLYVATMNNHLDIVKYLIEEAKCLIDAQNQDDVYTGIDTALHVACVKEHADIVRYLLGHGANCYLENKTKETPGMIARNSSVQYDIFRDHLVLDYTKQCTNRIELPTMTITNELSSKNYDLSSVTHNCIWEYKPLNEQHWKYFDEKGVGEGDGIITSETPSLSQDIKIISECLNVVIN
ncbi:hypothetical protein I4U23_015295 [Adineta vaga]|nr:hypothetical protein I4U23_015295 [Adineta vaga]